MPVAFAELAKIKQMVEQGKIVRSGGSEDGSTLSWEAAEKILLECCVLELMLRTNSGNADYSEATVRHGPGPATDRALLCCLTRRAMSWQVHKVLKVFLGAMWSKDGAGTSSVRLIRCTGLGPFS